MIDHTRWCCRDVNRCELCVGTAGAGVTYSMPGEREAVAAWVAGGGVTNSITCADATGTGASCTAAEVYSGEAGARRTV